MESPFEVDVGELGVRGLRPLLRALTEACAQQGADFFIIGALARDLLLEHIHGVGVPLTTRDVDVAVAVEGWPAYAALRKRLTEKHGFAAGPEKQRLRSPDGTPLDLVPYGGVEEKGGKARFPPEGSPELTVLGFESVAEAALRVRFGEGLVARFASLEGLALLKLIAWDERPTERARDAQDLCLLLQHFYDARLELITERHADLFDAENFSKPEASARALGRELARLFGASEEPGALLRSILRRETADVHQSRLARAMDAPGCYPQLDTRHRCLKALLTGVEERL